MASIQIAEELQHELVKVDDIGLTYIVGGSPNQIRVEPDPERLCALRHHARTSSSTS